MKQFTGVLALVAAIAAVQFTGCERSNMMSPATTDQQYFMDVVTGNDATTHDLVVSDQEALSDGQVFSVSQTPLPPSIQSVASDSFVPEKWGREIETVTRTLTRTTNQADTVSLAESIVTFGGHYVIIGKLNGVEDTVRKPYSESMHRFFKFLRISNSNHPRMNWKLDAVSIVNGGTTNATISLQQIQVVAPTETLTVTGPDTYFMQMTRGWMRHSVPTWGFNTTVTVLATVHSSDADTDLVMLHYAPRNFGLHRTPMTMISQSPNSAGGFDRVYSTSLTIPNNGHQFAHVVVSATTRASLYSADSTKFSSVLWGVPYKTSE